MPVIATEAGRFATGLGKGDFRISNNGNLEEIVATDEIAATAPSIVRIDQKSHEADNYRTGDSRQDNVILILDFLGVTEFQKSYVRQKLAGMLDALTGTAMPVTIVAVTQSGLLQVHAAGSPIGPLREAAQLWAARGRVGAGGGTVPPSAIAIETLASLEKAALPTKISRGWKVLLFRQTEQILEMYRGVPGRKKLIWVSSSFPFTQPVFLPEYMEDNDPAKPIAIRVFQAITQQNILVYGIVRPAAGGGGGAGADVNPGFDCMNISNATGVGGTSAPIHDRNICVRSPDKCLKRFLDGEQKYYLVSFYLRHDRSPGWHKVKVTGRPGLHIESRKAFFVGDDPPPGRSAVEKHQSVVSNALSAPFDYTYLPLQVRWTVQSDSARNVRLTVNAPPGAVTMNDARVTIEFAAYVRPTGKDDGVVEAALLDSPLTPDEQQQIQTGGFRYHHWMELAPGQYFVRVLVLDQWNGRIGTVSTTVDVPDSATIRR